VSKREKSLKSKVVDIFKKDEAIEKKLFIKDKPVEEIADDKFQYKQVAEIIFDLLKQNNFPLHIGMFGKWGSGKTSVIKLLDRLINADATHGKNYITKVISVWKFADDAPSLHRKIVREVELALELTNEEGIDRESSNTEGLTTSGGATLLSMNKGFMGKTLIYITVLMLIFAAAIIVNNPLYISAITNLVSLTTIVILFGLLNFLKGNFSRTSQITNKALPLKYGDQYEARFKLAVRNFLKKNHGKNLLLVFDDLDRLPPTQLVAALNSIKTFLHSDSCVFIIPCDKEILRQGVKSALREKDEVADIDDKFVAEFINKTFDYQIHLPILEQKNMKRYAKQLLSEQNISWLDDSEIKPDKLLGVLIHTAIKTPRQVKTLLNTFASNWILAKKRDREAGKKILTSNPLSVAVFTVLQTDFPEFYKLLESDPYLFNRENDIKAIQDNELQAYLSRIEPFIPKEDPRPFIYFSNEKLNPATGKPEVEKTKQYLINAQDDEFEKSFLELSSYDKGVVFSSVLSDIDDNASIETQNCLKTIIETSIDLSFVPEIDLHRWDQLLRENLNLLTEFLPSKVCKVLASLSDNSTTWNNYGKKIKFDFFYEDLTEVWVNNPEFIDKLGLSTFGRTLVKSYLEENNGFDLATKLLEVQKGIPFINAVDWIELLKQSYVAELEPPFSLVSWLNDWKLKTSKMLTPTIIIDLLKAYDFQSSKHLEGIGEVWCNNYENNDKGELLELIKLFKHETFIGFDNDDYKKLNNILTIQSGDTYANISKTVNSMLTEWWGEENEEKATDFISNLPDSPGVVSFCENNFQFELPEDTKELFLDIIVKRSSYIPKSSTKLLNLIKTEFANAGARQTKSKSLDVIEKLIQELNWEQKLKAIKSELVPIDSSTLWLNYTEAVVEEKLKVFMWVWNTNEEAVTWIFDCIVYLAKTAQGYINSGLPYYGYAARYLSMIIESVTKKYKHSVDWDDVIISWTDIEEAGRVKFDLFPLLETHVRGNVLGLLSRECSLGNNNFNNLLVKYADLSIATNREALFSRWETVGSENRKVVVEMFKSVDKSILSTSISLLMKHLNTNSSIVYLNEFVEWDVEDNVKEQILNSIIDSLDSNELSFWVFNSLDSMNKNGNDHWKGYCIKYASSRNLNIEVLDDNVIETSLGLGDVRATYALEILRGSNVSKGEMKKYRAKIMILHDKHGSLVEKLAKNNGWRFSKNK
jgi:hypothetical protein